ncbi:MAG: hypothetical protein ACO3I4_00300 [Candidatus Kapaibacteriota bacterium]
MKMYAVLLISLLLGAQSLWAQSTNSEDRSWLAMVVKPDVMDVQLVWQWDADSSRLIIDGVLVDWRDSTDARFVGRRFMKTVSCLPEGTLRSQGDSVVIIPAAASMRQLERIEAMGVYRLMLPLRTVGGGPVPEKPSGTLILNVMAGKLIDRKYSMEMTRQFVLELP